jgi:chromosome segregation ATPase
MTNHGRTYLTMLSDAELVRTALDRDHELAVVLAERLSELLDVEAQLDEAKNELDEVNKRLDHWQAEANMLQASLDRIDAE